MCADFTSTRITLAQCYINRAKTVFAPSLTEISNKGTHYHAKTKIQFESLIFAGKQMLCLA